ncbi:MAG: Ig-like domain-containing protein, partial [Aeromonas sp.]
GGLTISTPPLTLAAGLTGQLAATGSYSDGSNVDVTTTVSWTSSNPAVATVGLHTGLVTAVSPGTATITGALDGQTATLTVTVTSAVLNAGGLTITTPPLTVAAGLTGQLAATGSYSDGSNLDVTASVTWVSSNPAVATVNASGLVTGVAPGSTTITGNLEGQSAALAVTVTSAVLNTGGLTITVPPLNLVAGLTGQLAATGSYSDGTSVDVTNSVNWISNNPIVATVGLNTGLVTAVLPGTATITGTLDGQTATLLVTVTSATLNPGGLVITTSPLVLAAGLTGQLAATGSYNNGSNVDVTASVNWVSSNPAAATVSASGLVTAVAPGAATITGTLDGQIATLLVTVTNAVLTQGGLTITVPPLNLAAGLTGQLAANGIYSNGASVDVTTNVNWTSNNPLVAAVGLNSGLVTAVLPGTATITAMLDGQSTTVQVTVSNAVVVSVSIDPINPLAAGTTAQLKATATLSNLTTLDVTAQANWQSSDPSVFTVTSTGLATGVVPGSANVSVNVQGITAGHSVVVSNAVLTSIVISQSGLNLSPLLSTITFTAIGHYSDGSTQNITNSVIWKINGGLLTLGLGNTYVFLLNGNSHFTAELNGVTSNTLIL